MLLPQSRRDATRICLSSSFMRFRPFETPVRCCATWFLPHRKAIGCWKGQKQLFQGVKFYLLSCLSENRITHKQRCAAITSDMCEVLFGEDARYQACRSSVAAFILERGERVTTGLVVRAFRRQPESGIKFACLVCTQSARERLRGGESNRSLKRSPLAGTGQSSSQGCAGQGGWLSH